MILREFDFFSDCDRAVTNKLRSETRFLCALYQRCFDKQFKTKDTWKLEVKLVTECPDREVGFLDGLAIVELHYDARELLRLTPASKKNRETLKLLRTGAMRACKVLSWPTEPFEKAYECVISHDFKNEWTWKKSKWAPNRRLRAEIFCQHEAAVLRMHLQVRDRSENIHELKVIEAPPDEFLFSRFFGKLEWRPEGNLRWSSDDGEILWEGRAEKQDNP